MTLLSTKLAEQGLELRLLLLFWFLAEEFLEEICEKKKKRISLVKHFLSLYEICILLELSIAF